VLHVHRAERADGLVDALRALLAAPLPDPFAAEVVAVPTRGMERWLTQRISDRLGICANVEFPPPRALIGDAIATAAGVDPAADPWLPERMVWPLLDVVDAALDEPWAELLANHLSGSAEKRARRFATVRHLAGLFDRYALHRPALIEAWAAGAAPGDWQAELWRALRERIGAPGPAERLARACERLRAEPGLLPLPPRLALFGLTRLPAGHLDVLAALAAGRDVHLFLLHPSPALWERVAATVDAPVRRREDDPTKSLAANRLLASWGHDARELQLVLAGAGEHADHHHPVAPAGGTLLAAIQAGVRADAMPDATVPLDRSIEVHACHGRARQVEVLRDAILHLLADDPTLEPRDVIVMCPDIEAFAPLIHATFGAGEVVADDDAVPEALRPPDLRVRLADRSLRQTNPILGVIGALLDLAGERLTASQLLDLADREPVRRRFRLDDRDLVRMEDWVAASGIRWGLDAEHREPFKLAAVPAGTWRVGLDRLLVGVTMTEDAQRLFEHVLPLDDVDSSAIDLAGRLAELVERVGSALDALRAPQPIGAWAEALAQAADALTATRPTDAWQRAQLQRILDDVVEQAGGHAGDLALAEVRGLLAERIQGRPTRANFRTGHLTICTLVPMRSVPHRVVCLLGLDDGAFPRKSPRDGDDRLLDDPHVGERDPRAEDRQLLLDALMAATDRLIVTYTGNDERTNVARPPAVPVGELLDMVDRVAGAHEGIVVRHPLHPFDTRNFERGAILPGRSWSFDRVTLDGARALDAERAVPGPFLAAPLPDRADPVIELSELVRFVERPVRAFLRRRLGISVGEYEDEVDDALPVELSGLALWGVGQRVLEARLTGADARAALLAEIRRGTLPPGELGMPVIHRISPIVDEILAHVPTGPGTSLDVRLRVPGGRTLSGTVPGVVGDVLRTVTYSRVSARQRIAAWVRLLALTAAYPERPFEALTAGRAPREEDANVTVARIPPVGAEAARAELAAVIDLYDRGMREPPPLACQTSAAYAYAGANATAAARVAWESDFKVPKEDREPEHQLVHGGVVPFAALLEAPPRDDEPWNATEPSRFGRWARRLWDGLLEREEVTHR
jgi:exodeoxyribonuclease V gamma subunit